MALPTNTAQGGLSIVFPDVCYTPPGPIPGVPIPYPNIAATAARKQQQKKKVPTTTSQAVLVGGGVMKGRLAMVQAGVRPRVVAISAGRQAEIGALKSELNTVNNRLQSLPATDPGAWQSLLQEYLVLASGLYHAEKDDDQAVSIFR
jgi:hypothetical protein